MTKANFLRRSPPLRCARFEPLHSAWIDGELRRAERSALAGHLQSCARCNSRISELRVIRTLLRSMPPRRLPAHLGSALRQALPPGMSPTAQNIPAQNARECLRRAATRVAVTAAALLTVLSGAAFALGGDAPVGRRVAVPVDLYVADHLVHAVGGPVSTPVMLQVDP